MSQKSGKICIFLSNWIGDVIMSTPSIRLLHEHFGGQATFTVIGRPHLLQLLEGNSWIDQTIPFDPRGSELENRQRRVVRRLREERFDSMVLFPNSFRSALISWLGGARQRIGYGKQGRLMLLTHSVRPPDREIPLVDYYLNLTDAALPIIGARFGLTLPKRPVDASDRHRLELHTTPSEEKLGEEVWKSLGLRDPDKVVILNVSSANSLARNWPPDFAAKLARLIADQLDMDVLLNCGPGEVEIVRDVVERSKSPRVFSMADQPLNMHMGKICIKRARLTISTDSGPLHIAMAYGNPAIVLQGPTSETYIANPTVDLTVINRQLYCSPCLAKKQCPEKHHRCMLEITPEIVFEKVVEVLDSRKNPRE